MSAIIGTILMIAITVAVAATVFTVVNGFGSLGVEEPVKALYKAQAIDTNGNGKTETLKIAYMQGPGDLSASQVTISARDSAGGDVAIPVIGDGTWSIGDFVTAAPGPGTYYLSVVVSGNSMLSDYAISLQE